MSKAKILIIIVVIGVAAIFLWPDIGLNAGFGQDFALNELGLVEMAFQESEANFEGAEILIWGPLPLNSSERLLLSFGEIATKLGVEPQVSSEARGDYRTIKTIMELGNGSSLTLKIQENSAETSRNQILFASFSSQQQGTDLRDLDEILTRFLPWKSAAEYRKLVQFTGSFAGDLPRSVEKQVVEKVVRRVSAIRLYGSEDEQLLSVTALSPFSSAMRDALGNKFNLQLAFRYHNFDGRTYLVVGVPLLDGEF